MPAIQREGLHRETGTIPRLEKGVRRHVQHQEGLDGAAVGGRHGKNTQGPDDRLERNGGQAERRHPQKSTGKQNGS